MARIRSVKPDFWDSADTARASLRTRLLYIAMWNWADDYGIGDGHPGRIITFAFPNDDIPAADYPRLLADVSDAFGVVFFDHLERPYYTVPAWDKHQRTEKKAKPKDGLLEAAAAAVESDVVARQTRNAESPRNVADSPTLSDEPSDAGSWKSEGEREAEKEVELAPRAAPKPQRGTRLSRDWMPSEALIAEMKAECPLINLEAEHRKFLDYWCDKTGKDATKITWDGTWRNWIRNARPSPQQQTSTVDTKVNDWLNLANQQQPQHFLKAIGE